MDDYACYNSSATSSTRGEADSEGEARNCQNCGDGVGRDTGALCDECREDMWKGAYRGDQL